MAKSSKIDALLRLYRGLRGDVGHLKGPEPREDYRAFFSSSPHVAASYAGRQGTIFPYYAFPRKIIEFPTEPWTTQGSTMDKFGFDKRALQLDEGEGLVARNVYDMGPAASDLMDPRKLYSYPSDIWTFGPGTEFESVLNPGVREKYAKGGKVRRIKAEALERLLEHFSGGGKGSINDTVTKLLQDPKQGMLSENTDDYLEMLERTGYLWPDRPQDYLTMMDYAEAPGGGMGDSIMRLARKYAIDLPPDVKLYRGISRMEEEPGFMEEGWIPGKRVKIGNPEGGAIPTSTSRDEAANFVQLFDLEPDRNMFLNINREQPLRAFPLPMSGQSEVLLLPGQGQLDSLRSVVNSGRGTPSYLEADVTFTQRGVRPKYSGGGEVKEEAKKRKNALKFLSQVAALSSYLPNSISPGKPKNSQLFAQGALSQIYGLDEKGEPAFLGGSSWSHWPGLVDEVISLPTVLPDRFVPEVSKRAATRLEELNRLIHEDMDLASAKGLEENLYNAAGTMAAQIPMGGVKATGTAAAKTGVLSKVGKRLRQAGEWFTPTVEPKASNYIIGAVTGGGLNSLVAPEDEDQGVNVVSKYNHGGSVSMDLTSMRGRYAKGGKTGEALRAIDTAISAIEKGDRKAAVSVLEPHRSNGAVAEVLKTLKVDVE